jgi:TRAP-type mannitol/chloroaromatic compound transport system permease small subunit
VWGDRLMIGVGNVVSWIFPLLMVAIVTQVLIRKAGHNQAWLDDAQWWMYGFAMLTGFGYAITTESHVRVDIFHQHFSVTKRAWLEVFALGWLLLPFIGLMIDVLTQYSWSSVVAREGSDSPNGLHKLYLLKVSLPILFVLAGIAAWAALTRNLTRITTPQWWKLILAALPFSWFVAERVCHYALYWYVRFTQPELQVRRIAKEPLLEYSTWAGLVLLLIVLLIVFLARRQSVDRQDSSIQHSGLNHMDNRLAGQQDAGHQRKES